MPKTKLGDNPETTVALLKKIAKLEAKNIALTSANVDANKLASDAHSGRSAALFDVDTLKADAKDAAKDFHNAHESINQWRYRYIAKSGDHKDLSEFAAELGCENTRLKREVANLTRKLQLSQDGWS
jgi:hypothetical protein